jgi:hypothetical protein
LKTLILQSLKTQWVGTAAKLLHINRTTLVRRSRAVTAARAEGKLPMHLIVAPLVLKFSSIRSGTIFSHAPA